MSVLLLGRAFYTDLPSHLKLTLLAVADEASDDGTHIFIGQKRLALKIGTSERSVRTNLGELRARGYLMRLAEPHPMWGTDQYEIALEKLPHGAPEISSAPEAGDLTHRKPSVISTGSGLPPTRELPVRSTRKNDIAQAEAEFEAFWAMYPRRVGKGQARRAFKAARIKVDLATLGNAVEIYAESVKGAEPRFIAHPATWLNGERWADEAPPDRLGAMIADRWGADA